MAGDMFKDMFRDIKVVLLDIDDTLLDFTKCADFSLLAAAEELNVAVPGDFTLNFHRINSGLWHEVETGKMTVPQLYSSRFDKIFTELGILQNGHEFEVCFKKYLRDCAIKVDGAEELLSYLAPKYELGVASNGPYAQQKNRMEKAGLINYFTYFFVSENVGAAKPSPDFFNICVRATKDRNPAEILMIGDSIHADINGAADFGIKTIWFNKKNLPVSPDLSADGVVYSLAEIKNML